LKRYFSHTLNTRNKYLFAQHPVKIIRGDPSNISVPKGRILLQKWTKRALENATRNPGRGKL
jgi:hypothetical protein